MLVRKCDICGGEIRSADTRYKLVFESIFFKKEKDVCKECLQRIASEVRKDNSPQTDLLLKTPRKSRESHEKDTPQTDCETCKYGQDKHKTAVFARQHEGNSVLLRGGSESIRA